MNNPYPKMPDSERNAKYFTRHCKDRWAFFEASKGHLFASRERRKFLYQYARDYCYGIFERWARRYKQYLPEAKQFDFVCKIAERDTWGSRALTHYIDQNKYYPYIEGPTTEVAFYQLHLGMNEREKITCRYCGSNAVADMGLAKQGDYNNLRHYYSRSDTPDDGDCRSIEFADVRCPNNFCKEVIAHWNGQGAARDRAKMVKVKWWVPKKDIEGLTPSEQYTIVAANLLDMEARTIEKERIGAAGTCHNGPQPGREEIDTRPRDPAAGSLGLT